MEKAVDAWFARLDGPADAIAAMILNAVSPDRNDPQRAG